MNQHPLSDLERDACLMEDVVSDALDAWTLAKQVDITPRSFARLVAVRTRLSEVDVQLRNLRVGLHQAVTAVERERKRSKPDESLGGER